MPTPWIHIAQAPRDVADAQPARGRSVVAQLLALVADEARTPWAAEESQMGGVVEAMEGW